MVVEPESFCWSSGRLVNKRDGQTWADELRGYSSLEYIVRDAGTGLSKGISLVQAEGINSVARMHQSRHRKMTQGLLDLKRLYWNMRPFRTGRRRGKSPYALLGLKLPTNDWWELLKLPPDQLAQHLSTQ